MTQANEVWLRQNRRVFFMAAVAPALLLVLGLAVALDAFSTAPTAARVLAGTLAVLGGILSAVLIWYARQPRLAYDGRHLIVYLRSGGPIAVPIEAVECFFLGSGLRELPGRAGREVEVAQLVVRLAERATEWAQANVKPALGKWCGGYITIYGTWCEPLSLELVRRLNVRLAEALESRREVTLAEPAVR
jgi:hypothetical protein